MDNLFNVSTAPHIRSSITTKNIMYDVIISLLPATFFGIYQFGFNAFLVITTATLSYAFVRGASPTASLTSVASA